VQGITPQGTTKTSGVISSGGSVLLTRTSRGTLRVRSFISGSEEVPRYRAGRGQTNINAVTLTSSTPAAAVTQTTSPSAGCRKAESRLAVMVRGSIKSSRSAHGTHQHIFERHQSGDTVATHNHIHQVRGAKMRVPFCSEEKAQQLSRIGRTT